MATSDKYDRQLRVWGSNGQRALMQSNILLINANAVGTETIKNLILPGVGQFTILDHELVTENDLGTNFFVDSSSLGQPRAEVVTRSLQELNPDVKGTAHVGAISSILLTEPNYLQQFNLIVAANLIETNLVLLATICNAFNIPLVVVRSYGLIGYCRLQINHHEIVESRPEIDTIDLSLAHPFPELTDFCTKFDFLRLPHSTTTSDVMATASSANMINTTDINGSSMTYGGSSNQVSTDMHMGVTEIHGNSIVGEKMDTLTHSHIPYVVILYQAMIQWHTQYGDHYIPRTTAEKEIFKRMITCMSFNINNEVNFQEAIKECHRAWFDSSVSAMVANNNGGDIEDEAYKVVLSQKDKVLTIHSSFFSLMVRALQYFLEYGGTNNSNAENNDKGLFPVVGTLPDMTATTEYFTALQKVYHTKAQNDKILFINLLRNVLIEAGYYNDNSDNSSNHNMNNHDSNTVSHTSIITTTTSILPVPSSGPATTKITTVEEMLNRHTEDIDIFCRNTRNIRQISTRTIAEERYALLSEKLEEFMTDYLYDDDPEQTPIYYYLALRAVDVFYTRHQRYPGCVSGGSGVSTGVSGGSGVRTGVSGGSGVSTGVGGGSGVSTGVSGGSGVSTGVGGGSGVSTGVGGSSGVSTGVGGSSRGSEATAQSDTNELWVEIQHLLTRSFGNNTNASNSNTANSITTAVGTVNKDTASMTISASASTSPITTTTSTNAVNQEYDISSHIFGSLSIKHVQEMTRYGGEEYHTVSAVIGGVAAQEIVKILTHQYICINHILVYNGICSVMNIYEL